MILPSDHEYLISRLYTPQMIEQEGWFSIASGLNHISVLDLVIETKDPLIGVPCKSPAGTVTAISTVNPREKDYRRFRTIPGNYLPVFFGSEDDWNLLEMTGQAFMVEGIFDRVAIKRCGLEAAVFCNFGLGLSARMQYWYKRYARRVWLMMDMDTAGRKAASHMVKALRSSGVSVEDVQYPYKDPSEWATKRGIEGMSVILRHEMTVRGWG